MLYLALTSAPSAVPTGEVTVTKAGEEIRWHRITGWRELGIVDAKTAYAALDVAKHKWGGSPAIVDMNGKSVH
jgi:hypothetical protein